jgi:hypothetical protein
VAVVLLKLTAPEIVVVPCLRIKLVAETEELSRVSEKVAVILLLIATPVAPLTGDTEDTVGGVVSAVVLVAVLVTVVVLVVEAIVKPVA